MPNGKPGDHPLTDILVHGHPVFTPQIDSLVLKLAKLCSPTELDCLVDWLDPPAYDTLKVELETALPRFEKRAKQGGWETAR